MHREQDAAPIARADGGIASQRVRHLLDVARAQFVRSGFEASSIDAIARAGNVSKETIYRHFADKEQLFRAALDAAGAEFTARTAAVHDVAATPGLELAGLARAILDTAVDHGMFSALWVATSVADRMPDLAHSLQQGQWRRLEPVRQALEDYARERGAAARVPLELALDFGSLAVEGPAVLMGFAPPPPAGRDRIAARVASLFAEGVDGVMAEEGPSEITAPPPAVPGGSEPPPHIGTLLAVAARHFLASGFERSNLDLIGAEARVGRGTLYRHFEGKAGLFAAAMREAARGCAPPGTAPPLPPSRRDRGALAAFLQSALASLASAASIRLHRIVISQSRRDPSTAREVHSMLRAPWIDELAPWIRGLGVQGDAGWQARQLLVLALKGNRLFAGGQPMPEEERRRQADRAAAIFLAGFTALI